MAVLSLGILCLLIATGRAQEFAAGMTFTIIPAAESKHPLLVRGLHTFIGVKV
jgi:hypothetical protein